LHETSAGRAFPFDTAHTAGRAGAQTPPPLRRTLFDMNWDRIQSGWKVLKSRVKLRWVRQAREKQLAEWIVREHKADPIHK
jgi:hypothetical protein